MLCEPKTTLKTCLYKNKRTKQKKNHNYLLSLDFEGPETALNHRNAQPLGKGPTGGATQLLTLPRPRGQQQEGHSAPQPGAILPPAQLHCCPLRSLARRREPHSGRGRPPCLRPPGCPAL